MPTRKMLSVKCVLAVIVGNAGPVPVNVLVKAERSTYKVFGLDAPSVDEGPFAAGADRPPGLRVLGGARVRRYRCKRRGGGKCGRRGDAGIAVDLAVSKTAGHIEQHPIRRLDADAARTVPNHGSFCENVPVVVMVGNATAARPGTVTIVGSPALPLSPVP